jgi:hypothetical protein
MTVDLRFNERCRGREAHAMLTFRILCAQGQSRDREAGQARAPLGPTRATNCPGLTSIERPRRTGTWGRVA